MQIETFLTKNHQKYKDNVLFIGSYLLQSDQKFEDFLRSKYKDTYIMIIEKYLIYKLNGELPYEKGDGERLYRYIFFYARLVAKENIRKRVENKVMQRCFEVYQQDINHNMIIEFQKYLDNCSSAKNKILFDYIDLSEKAHVQIEKSYTHTLEKRHLEIRELYGMIHFYTSIGSYRLDKQKAFQIIEETRLKKDEDMLSYDHRKTLVSCIIDELIDDLKIEGARCKFISEEELLQLLFEGKDKKEKITVDGVYMIRTNKIFLNENIYLKNTDLYTFLTSIRAALHEIKHSIQQKRDVYNVCDDYENIKLIYDELIMKYYAKYYAKSTNYYNENYRILTSEIQAENFSCNYFKKLVLQYMPSFSNYIKNDIDVYLKKLKELESISYRMVNGKYIMLDQLFRDIVNQMPNKDVMIRIIINLYPELKKEYHSNGKRKKTIELDHEIETIDPSLEKKRKCYYDIMTKRSFTLDELMEDFIDLIENGVTSSISKRFMKFVKYVYIPKIIDNVTIKRANNEISSLNIELIVLKYRLNDFLVKLKKEFGNLDSCDLALDACNTIMSCLEKQIDRINNAQKSYDNIDRKNYL